jgi:hypothetical protein
MESAPSRRDAIKSGIGFLGALGVLAANSTTLVQRIAGWLGSPAFIHPASLRVLENLKRTTLTQYLNDIFTIRSGHSRGERLKLVETVDLSQGAADLASLDAEENSGEVFSILFSCPAPHSLVQDTYTLQHDSIGEFPLFLVPIYPDEGKAYFEAVIDRRNAA